MLPKPEKSEKNSGEAPTAGDDAQEAGQGDMRDSNAPRARGKKDKPKKGGQNTNRKYGRFEDANPLCNSRAMAPEFSPADCRFGDKCKTVHSLREYMETRLKELADLALETDSCRLYEVFGQCPSGWKCRFVKHHMTTYKHEDGREELVLTRKTPASDDESATPEHRPILTPYEPMPSSTKNIVSKPQKIELNRRRADFSKANQYCDWLDKEAKIFNAYHNRRSHETMADLRASFVEPPFEASEKRRLYFGPETPLLAPLTTQGNLPYRRLCIDFGAELTYSEMAMTTPLLQGSNADWTLMRAHESELTPPKVNTVVDGYDNSRDLKFGAQISGHSHSTVSKGASILSRYCPHLRLIDLNCGCPIDMVYKSGAGAGVLESQGKLERMVRGMNAVSGEIPITVKIRTGIQSNRPVATKIIGNLAFGAREHRERLGAPGCAAITLHGRSREQRYTKKANWDYIGECASMVKQYNAQKAAITDTINEPDARTLANAKDGKMSFIGNGDCYSHVDYYDHIDKAGVDSVMLGRGALIKPWIFEEIKARQYLDKSSSERMEYIKKYVDYGLEAWGTDDIGVGYTRRFLLEWLSFAHRYIPIGLLSHLPPDMNQRPEAYIGRDDFETKLASQNYKDWISLT
ncbi:tRNA-dihydrouridine synthase family protein [Candidatus Bathyarchaeota archaeon]|nr:tRNA-dihydrouridine synthase family protein [Candidatus Bathyarchaeota archaeon]